MPRKQLIGFGTAFGKFTKTKQFRLHVTCLDYVAQHAQHKVWLKPSAEQSFLYGNHVLKARYRSRARARARARARLYGNHVLKAGYRSPSP